MMRTGLLQVRHARSGFTILELLMVISIITMLLVAGVATFSGFISKKSIELGTRVVANAARAARQYAVSKRERVMMQLYDVSKDDMDDNDDLPDMVILWRFALVRDAETGSIGYLVDPTPMDFFELTPTLKFFNNDGAMEVGMRNPEFTKIGLNVDTDGDGKRGETNVDGEYMEASFIVFFPDGSSRASPPNYPDTEKYYNMISLVDEANRLYSLVYIYPVTSFTKEIYPDELE